MQIKFDIEGISPLLQHRFIADERVVRKRGERPTSEEEVEQALYKTSDGMVYQPGESIKRAMMSVASGFRIVGRGKKTYKDTISGGIVISPVNVLTPQTYTIDARRVRIGTASIVRYRPRWDAWSVKAMIDILDEDLPTEIAKEILEQAGRKMGIGDNRINGFGRFKVTKWEVSD